MADIDPSEFDDRPARSWGEAARRIAIVRRYLDDPERGVAKADAAAGEIGIGRRMFYQLVETLVHGAKLCQRPIRSGRSLLRPR